MVVSSSASAPGARGSGNLLRRNHPRPMQAGCPAVSASPKPCPAPCRTWRKDAHRVSTCTLWREPPSQPGGLHRSRRENQRPQGPPGMSDVVIACSCMHSAKTVFCILRKEMHRCFGRPAISEFNVPSHNRPMEKKCSIAFVYFLHYRF